MIHQIVHVQWVDSQSQNGWHDLSDLELERSITHSVGLLITDNKEYIVVAHSFDPETDHYNGIMRIPKACILKTRTICRVTMTQTT